MSASPALVADADCAAPASTLSYAALSSIGAGSAPEEPAKPAMSAASPFELLEPAELHAARDSANAVAINIVIHL
jgi:hypothetical protein